MDNTITGKRYTTTAAQDNYGTAITIPANTELTATGRKTTTDKIEVAYTENDVNGTSVAKT